VTAYALAKGLNAYNLPQSGTRELTAVRVEYCQNGVNTCAILASVYMSTDARIPSPEVVQLIAYCENNKLPVIIGCDTNSHHIAWGNTCNNPRGQVLAEFLASTNLEIINVGGESTFVSGNHQSASQWVDGGGEHTKISQKMAQLMPLSQARCDRRVPKYYFDKYFTVQIPSREQWITQQIILSDEIVCFTDGSCRGLSGPSGAAVYTQDDDQKYM